MGLLSNHQVIFEHFTYYMGDFTQPQQKYAGTGENCNIAIVVIYLSWNKNSMKILVHLIREKSILQIFQRGRLFGGTVLPNNFLHLAEQSRQIISYLAGHVPPNNFLLLCWRLQ